MAVLAPVFGPHRGEAQVVTTPQAPVSEDAPGWALHVGRILRDSALAFTLILVKPAPPPLDPASPASPPPGEPPLPSAGADEVLYRVEVQSPERFSRLSRLTGAHRGSAQLNNLADAGEPPRRQLVYFGPGPRRAPAAPVPGALGAFLDRLADATRAMPMVEVRLLRVGGAGLTDLGSGREVPLEVEIRTVDVPEAITFIRGAAEGCGVYWNEVLVHVVAPRVIVKVRGTLVAGPARAVAGAGKAAGEVESALRGPAGGRLDVRSTRDGGATRVSVRFQSTRLPEVIRALGGLVRKAEPKALGPWTLSQPISIGPADCSVDLIY